MSALDQLRQLYFQSSERTIEDDLSTAIALFKQLTEDERGRAAVFMEGLAEMRREWGRRGEGATRRPRPRGR